MDAEVIVVGGGIVGLWTAYTLASQGVRTSLFEQFPYPHTRGSSHGQSRITRTAYSQEMYSAMMPDANRRWKELARNSGTEVYVTTGLLTIYDVTTMEKMFEAMRQNMDKYEPNYEVINGDDIQGRFPGVVCGRHQKAIFDKGAGLLRADNCLLALQQKFQESGGILRDREPVVSINPISDREVEVVTDTKKYLARSVVLTCGTYINKLLATVDWNLPVKTTRQHVYYWTDKSESKYAAANKFPNVILTGRPEIYSIPSYEYPGLIKVCCHEPAAQVDPLQRDQVTPKGRREGERYLDLLKSRMNSLYTDVDTSSPAVTEVCMYTVSPDSGFIIDYHPKFKNIIVGSGFSGIFSCMRCRPDKLQCQGELAFYASVVDSVSFYFPGHGFKTSPSVGNMLANMALGLETPYPRGPFSLNRFQTSSRL